MFMPKPVKIVEVGPRDGLQNEAAIVPTEVKLDFIRKLGEAGLRFIEVTSFVSPRSIPQLSDAIDLVRALERPAGMHYSALVPNMRGLERAMESGIREIAVFTAASDTFNLHNIRMTVDESLANFEPVVQRALSEGMAVRGYVSTAFVCPFEGRIDAKKVLDVTKKLVMMGVSEVSIGDTIGQATPDDVRWTMRHVLQTVPAARIAMHFHDTNGLALENVQASLNLGIRTFDSSAGGLGGCPYAPGASGNLATGDLVQMLHAHGYETGVDLDKLYDASATIRRILENTDDLLITPENLTYNIEAF